MTTMREFYNELRTDQEVLKQTNGIPLPLCLYLTGRKAELPFSVELALLSDLGSPEEYAETDKWLRKHTHCGLCRGPLYKGIKKPELEFCNENGKPIEVRAICGLCLDAKRALFVFREFLNEGLEVTLDILPPEEFAAVDRFLKNKRFCDECVAPLGEDEKVTHMAARGSLGIRSFSICGGCNERWTREASLPNILTELTEGER